MLTSELLRIFRDKQRRDESPYWGCRHEPTEDEILEAIRAGKLTRWSSHKDNAGRHVQGNRPWHIERIAWLVMSWSDDYPVEINADRSDLNGGHRVYAALVRGIEELETVPFQN